MKPKFRSLIAAFAPLSRTSLIVCASLCAAASANADQTWTGATSVDWNTSTNWTSAVPGAADIAIFDTASTANLATTSSTAFSLKGVQVISPAAAVSIAFPVVNKVTAAALTVNFTTDTFTYSPVTPLANGDFVTLGGTMPTGLTGGLPYYVVNATATTFQVSLTQGGTPVDFTTAGTTVTATGGYGSAALGTSGIDLSLATQNLTVSAPLTVAASQSWNVGTGMTLTATGSISGPGQITKGGPGNLLVTNANNLPSGFSVSGGQLTTRNGLAFGLGTLNLANGTTLRIETTNGGNASGSSIFVGNPITVAAGSSVTMTNNSAGNGYSGLVTGDANSVFNIGASGAVVQNSFSLGSNTQQFGNFLGRIEIFDGASIRFSSTSSLNNGGASAIWDTNATGIISARNNGTVNLGSLVGAGSVSGSSGADNNTTTFSIGGRNEDCTYDGSLVNSSSIRLAALTKVGSATLTLTNTTGLTYTGATNVNAGTLKINGVKSGTGTTTVKIDTTLAGTGSIAGITTVQSGGTVAPGDGGIGNLTFSSLSLNTGSKLNLQFGVGNDKATVSSGGTLTLASGLTVDVNGFGTPGTYTIIDVTGATVSGTAATAFTATNVDSSKVYSFASTGSAITMTISSTDPNNFWAVDGAGSWATAANWTKTLVPNLASAIAKIGPGPSGLGGTFGSNPDITLDGNKTVGLISFNDEFGAVITINPGIVTPGTLNIDDGAVPGNIVVGAGFHIINAPVAVDAQGVAVDTAASSSLTMNGVLSGSSAALTKNGAGDLVLTGNNTYAGGTVLVAGRININSATSMGGVSAPATFSGGTLLLGSSISGITRSYLVTGANSALIDTNGFDFGYGGVISPTVGATGGLTKSGLGLLTLTAAQAYTGTTSVAGGELVIDAGGAITGGAVNTTTAGGGLIHIKSAGTLTGTSCTLNPQSGGLFMDTGSGNVTFSGALSAINTTSNGNSAPVRVTTGALTAPSIQLGRTGLSTTAEPTAAPTNTNLYVSGGTVSLTGDLNVGAYTGSTAPNSSVVARVDGGTVTVGGAISIGVNNSGRWSYFDMNGGTLVNTGAVADSGLVIGGPLIGKSAFLMHAGTATVERIQFGRGAVDGQGLLNISGGLLYVGSGGISLGSTGVFPTEIRLSGGTLGAKAAWSSSMPANISVTSTIKAADAADVARDIALSGDLSGAGGLVKTGGGTLTLAGTGNTYAGTTTITAGKLAITGNNGGAIGDVSVASGASLGGSGNIGGSVTVDSGGRQEFAVAANPALQPLRHIAGTLTLTGSTLLDLTKAAPVAGGQYILATAPVIAGVPAQGNYNGITAVASVISGGDGQQLVITVTAGDFDTWIGGFTFASGADVTATGDPDGDGLTNQQEYAFGLIPNSGASVNPITGQLNKTTGLFTYTRRKPSLTGLTYIYQYSTNLGSWSTFTPDSTTSNSGDPVEAITVDVPNALLNNSTFFVRVLAQ